MPRCLGALVVGIPLLAGCGQTHETLYPVSGKVTFQGKPVSAGIIRFSNKKVGIDITAPLCADGGYEMIMARGSGLPTGAYQVSVLPPRFDLPIGAKPPFPKTPKCLDIPEQYRLPLTSGLTMTVKSEINRFDVDMQSDR